MQLKKLQAAGLSTLFLLTQGYAAPLPFTASQLPASTLPETVSQSLSSSIPQPSGVSAPLALNQELNPAMLGPEAKKIKLVLNGIILEGNKTYSTAQLAPLYQHQLKKTISVADLFVIVTNITNYYRNNGYIISRAILPPQHVKNGVVTIKIIEGYISGLSVTGHYHGAKCFVKAIGEQIKKCPPLHLTRLEKYLLYANEVPATQIKAVLAPSKTDPGAADLTLVTENSPVTGYISYDDYGTLYIGPQQITANLGLNSFVTSGDSTQFSFSKTPKGGELTYADINYNMPVNEQGVRFLIGGTRANTQPLYVLTTTKIAGLTDNYYASMTFPLIRSRTKSLTFQAGLSYNDSEVTSLDQKLYQDHVRSLDLGTTYNFADTWSGVNLVGFDFRQGIPFLGYTSNTNPDTALTSRPGGRGDYTKVTLQLSRLQLVKGPFSLYGLFRGQWACNPLLASEQFSFGGSQLGRGYDVAEIIGDKGTAASVELRYDLNINRLLIQNLQLYTFYDGGMVWDFKKLQGTPGQISATSAGFGTRFYFTKYVSGNVMWTQTLTKTVAAEQIKHDGSRPRVFFSVVASFN